MFDSYEFDGINAVVTQESKDVVYDGLDPRAAGIIADLLNQRTNILEKYFRLLANEQSPDDVSDRGE